MARPKLLLSWSSGKDSAHALFRLRSAGDYDVVGLFTTCNDNFERVSMHGTRLSVLHAQAASVRLPLRTIRLPWPCTNEEYEAQMARFVTEIRADGITHVAFGDIHLTDVRDYRIQKLNGTGITPVFPLWCSPTATTALAQEMCATGLQARIVCLDPTRLDPAFIGRDFDAQLLRDLPPTVDPCAEKGEFHTLAYNGPVFAHPLMLRRGDTVTRDGLVYTDFEINGAAHGEGTGHGP